MTNAGPTAAATAASDSRDTVSLEIPAGKTRRSSRILLHLPGLISWQDGEMERIETVFTTSVSRFGCALQCHTFFKPGTRLRLDFAGKAIQGHVVYSLKDHSANLVTVGVAFDRDARAFWPVGFELGR